MRVLVAFNNSETSKCALKYALEMNVAVDYYLVLYVYPETVGVGPVYDTYIPEKVYEKEEDKAQAILNDAKKLMEGISTPTEFLAFDAESKDVAEAITEIAKEKKIDLIVTGSRNLKGIERIVLGSVSEGILRHSTVPVLICAKNSCSRAEKK